MQLETCYFQGSCFSSEPYDARGHDRGQTRTPAGTDARRRRQRATNSNNAMMANTYASNAGASANAQASNMASMAAMSASASAPAGSGC